MAKTKGPSKHSRAARRATSLSIDTDKSLKDLRVPKRSSANSRPSVLAVHHSAGVTKKVKPTRKSRMSTKMRRRHEKGLEMAEAVTERTGKKIEKSITRAQVVQKRSRTWDEVNKEADADEVVDGHNSGSRFGALADEAEWETDGAQDEDGFNPQNPAASTKIVDDEEEEETL